MRGPNGAKEAGAFSGMDQLYWPPLCRVKATPEVRAVANLQIGKLRDVKSSCPGSNQRRTLIHTLPSARGLDLLPPE